MPRSLSILFEDNHIIAVNKTNHDIVQPDTTGDISLEERVKAYIKEKYNKPGEVFLGVVHRIDRPVSGAVLFARTSKALERLNKMFQDKQIQKTYWAIVRETPPQDRERLTHYIRRDTKTNKSTAHDKQVPESKLSELTYTVRAHSENYCLLEIDLHTGRHHQIRCQLSKIGCPIKGDLKYGFPRSNPDGGISLHSRSIAFEHPVTKEKVLITAPVPDVSLWKSITSGL